MLNIVNSFSFKFNDGGTLVEGIETESDLNRTENESLSSIITEELSNKNIDKPVKNTNKIATNFKLPIYYVESEKLHDLSSIVSNDLELAESSKKPIYEYLFQPKHDFARETIPQWNQWYTTDIAYLKNTQLILNNMRLYKDAMSGEPEYVVDCENFVDTWNIVKGDDDFMSKYSYIEWDFIKELNESSTFLQCVSALSILSPVISLSFPFIILLFPFLILKFQGLPITFELYYDILKTLAQSHFVGKAFFNIDSASPDKILYLFLTIGFYLFQIYQNIIQCGRFYMNIQDVNNRICEMSNYVGYSVRSMENFLEVNKNAESYRPFFENIQKHCSVLKSIKQEFDSVGSFDHSFSKVCEMGVIMKCFYKLHSNKDYENALRYSVGFEGYINNMLGVYDNYQSKKVFFAEYDTQSKMKMTKQYYPPLMDENPVLNNCKFDKNMVVTGVNASGKTTILKTTTINIIFSQQIGCGFYQSCVLNPYTHIHSYLNIPDTSGRDSLFQAESRRCKEIIDVIAKYDDSARYRHYCIFDELYSGTNPVEATKSAYAFLKYLCKYENVDFILTTHYTSICNRMKKSPRIQNYKMVVESSQSNGELNYTYKMKKGVSKIQGAIKILQQMDYPPEIIKDIMEYSKSGR